MDKGKIVEFYKDKLDTNLIFKTYKEFNLIRDLLYVSGNLDETVGKYLHLESLQKQNQIQIQNIQKDNQKIRKVMFDLKNQTITELRQSKKLYEWLNNLNDDDLFQLKQIVDIETEFKEISDFRFNESKKNRGKVYV